MNRYFLQSSLAILLLFASAAHAQPFYNWADALPGFSTAAMPSQNQVNAVRANKKGEVYVLGTYLRGLDMNPGSATDTVKCDPTATDFCAYFGKYTASGNYIWGYNLGQGGGQTFCFNDSGHLFMGGFIGGLDSFGLGHVVDTCSTPGLFLIKYDSNEHIVWRRVIPTPGGSGNIVSIKADNAGNIYATGEFTNTVDFDPLHPGAVVFTSSLKDGFVAKFNNGGNLVWVRRINSMDGDKGNALQVDGDGNVIITGYSRGTANFMDTGGVTRTVTCHTFGYDAILAKYTNDGAIVWLKAIGGDSHDYGLGVATDSHGNVYASGKYADSMEVDAATHTSLKVGGTNEGGYLIKYDAAGGFLWAKTYGVDTGYYHYTTVETVICDDSDNVLLSGPFQISVALNPSATAVPQLGGQKGNPGGNRDFFVLKLDQSGNYKWHLHNHSKWDNVAYSLTLDNAQNMYFGGYITDTTDFDPASSAGTVGFPMPNPNWAPVSFFCKYSLAHPVLVENIGENMPLTIYPNPAGDHLVIAGDMTAAILTVYDLMGKVHTLPMNGRGGKTTVETTTLTPGSYIVECSQQGIQARRAIFVKY